LRELAGIQQVDPAQIRAEVHAEYQQALAQQQAQEHAAREQWLAGELEKFAAGKEYWPELGAKSENAVFAAAHVCF
jgi:hypothetical protein